MLRKYSSLPTATDAEGEKPWLDSVEIAEVRWRMGRDFVRSAERAWVLRRRMLPQRLQLLRHLHPRLRRYMQRLRYRPRQLRLLLVRPG
jgi:hypothetical protein